MAAQAASGTVTLPRETIALLETKAVVEGKTVDELANDSIHAHLSRSSTIHQAAKAAYTPQTHLRERSIVPKEAALLFIDVQNYNCHRSGVEAAHFGTGPDMEYWWKRVEEVSPTWTGLRDTCREAGVEVMYTVIQSLTADGRDQSLDYKISGFHVPPGSFDAQVLDCIAPGSDEIVLPKTSSSVFSSTNVDYILRSLEKKYLILAGCVTDQCVESAVREACDKHYYVTLVTDACATFTQERHDNSLRAIKGFCRQRTLSELKAELEQAT